MSTILIIILVLVLIGGVGWGGYQHGGPIWGGGSIGLILVVLLILYLLGVLR